jgi:hypothetical protein
VSIPGETLRLNDESGNMSPASEQNAKTNLFFILKHDGSDLRKQFYSDDDEFLQTAVGDPSKPLPVDKLLDYLEEHAEERFLAEEPTAYELASPQRKRLIEQEMNAALSEDREKAIRVAAPVPSDSEQQIVSPNAVNKLATGSDGSEEDETLHGSSPKPQPGKAPSEFNVEVSEEAARRLRNAIARDPNPEVDSNTRVSAAHEKPARIPLVIPPRKEPLNQTSPIRRLTVPSESEQKTVAPKTVDKLAACRAAAAKRITHCEVEVTTCGGSLSCEKVRCNTSFTGCDDTWYGGPFEFYCDTGNTSNRDARYENVIAKACPAH